MQLYFTEMNSRYYIFRVKQEFIQLIPYFVSILLHFVLLNFHLRDLQGNKYSLNSWVKTLFTAVR